MNRNQKDGIRKVNEWILQLGRTLTVTDPNIEFTNFVDGTMLIPEDGIIKAKIKGENDWIRLTPSHYFENKTITSTHIANGTIINSLIADNTIENEKLKDLTLTAIKIANNTITADKLLDETIVNQKIALNTITNNRLADKTITSDKIADNAITSSNIANGTITSDKLANGTITSDKLSPGAISGGNITINSITTDKLSDRSVTSVKIAIGGVQAENILDGTIVSNKLANNSIISSKIGDNSVITSKISAAAVTTPKIADNNITTQKINNLAVTNAKIANNTISIDKLSSTLKTAINSAIKVDATGVATVNGNLKATGTITATKVYNAVYNDLAEGYVPGEKLTAGDIVEIREDGKVYKATIFSKSCVGVVSDEYAECFGATEYEIQTGKKVAVGLIGKVHVKIKGPVQLGQRIVSFGHGYGVQVDSPKQYHVVGKALESKTAEHVDKVLCLIYPN